MNFNDYLQQKKHSAATIKIYTAHINRFLTWCQTESISSIAFDYNDLLHFMRWCKAKGITAKTVHNILCVIRHYAAHLIEAEQRSDNPAAGLFIKGLIRKLPVNLLSSEEMDELHRFYSLQLHVDTAKKIMLGLLVYQGITVSELMQLQAHHFRLQDGKVLIKGSRRSNERLLLLQAIQIPALQDYLNRQTTGSLFIEAGNERNMNNRLQHLFGQLKRLNSNVINAKQIRSSVITNWLRSSNLRQVQYQAGHKHVSSTERYQLTNLDDLQNELQQHHPGR